MIYNLTFLYIIVAIVVQHLIYVDISKQLIFTVIKYIYWVVYLNLDYKNTYYIKITVKRKGKKL